MNNITKIVLAVITAVVIYFVLVKGPEQTNSTQRSADDRSSSRRPSIFDTKKPDATPSNTPSRGNSTGTLTNAGTRPATPDNMNERETGSKTTPRNGRVNSNTGNRTTSSTSSRNSERGTNPRRVSRQYYPLQ